MLDKLRTKEVSLNHVLSLFFSLAPTGLVTRLLERHIPSWHPEQLVPQVNPKLSVAPTIDICQTDFLFNGNKTLVAIEMKIKHKINIEQLIKYSLFLYHYGWKEDSPRKSPFLLYLIPSAEKIWKNRLCFSSYQSAIEEFEFNSTIESFAAKCGQSRADVLALARQLSISHMTYSQFRHFLIDEIASLDESDGSETLRNLINGVLDELAQRGLGSTIPD